MASIKNFSAATMDWREQLRKNTIKTRWVICIYVLLYIFLGLLIDISLSYQLNDIDPLNSARALLSLKILPTATIITCCIAIGSLVFTYALHNKLILLGTSYREITPENALTLSEKQLYHVVEEMKVAAGLHYLPKVYLIDANYMNAFASGYSEKSALIAITKGLLEKLDRNELQAVIAHELSHIRHADIKLTLMASVLSNLILMLIDQLFFFNFNTRSSKSSRNGNTLILLIYLLRYILPLLTILLMFYLSRTREYMADAGCVELMRNNLPLGSALIKIHQDHCANQDEYSTSYRQTAHEDVRHAAYLYDPRQAGITPFSALSNLFITHPSLEQRLAALGIKLTQ